MEKYLFLALTLSAAGAKYHLHRQNPEGVQVERDKRLELYQQTAAPSYPPLSLANTRTNQELAQGYQSSH